MGVTAGITTEHEQWMRSALELARRAESIGEVPVGALLIRDGEVVGQGFNEPISRNDPSAHAEILALRSAALELGNYRLPGTTLYVTVEPCTMCAGALIHARVQQVVFGAREPKGGALVSRPETLSGLNHSLEIVEGVLASECGEMLSGFFSRRRETNP